MRARLCKSAETADSVKRHIHRAIDHLEYSRPAEAKAATAHASVAAAQVFLGWHAVHKHLAMARRSLDSGSLGSADRAKSYLTNARNSI